MCDHGRGGGDEPVLLGPERTYRAVSSERMSGFGVLFTLFTNSSAIAPATAVISRPITARGGAFTRHLRQDGARPERPCEDSRLRPRSCRTGTSQGSAPRPPATTGRPDVPASPPVARGRAAPAGGPGPRREAS